MIARASGGLRVLVLLGAVLVGGRGALRAVAGLGGRPGCRRRSERGASGMDNFERAFTVTVVGHEGGYDARPRRSRQLDRRQRRRGRVARDAFGISAAAYPTLDIAGLSLADAAGDLSARLLGRHRGDRLPPPLALLVFDAAVNNGCGRAARWLQSVAGAVPDGAIGVRRWRRSRLCRTHRGAALCAEFMAQRMMFMAALPTWRLFGLGWARRLCSLPYQSLTMTGAP